jgi:hypothetical protein
VCFAFFCALRLYCAVASLFAAVDCRYGELVRVLGLGGVVTFDYSEDARKARLVGCDEDYVNFEGATQQESKWNAGFKPLHLCWRLLSYMCDPNCKGQAG